MKEIFTFAATFGWCEWASTSLEEDKHSPMRGTKSDVAGKFSAINSINTEKASNTVRPRVT